MWAAGSSRRRATSPADEDYPEDNAIVLGITNLNTLGSGAPYEALEAAEAHHLAARFEWHRTPKHGSWLNILFSTPYSGCGQHQTKLRAGGDCTLTIELQLCASTVTITFR